MKGTVIEWGPAIIMGVLFAGTVSVVGYGNATDFLFLTNSDSTSAQLDTLARKVTEQCNAPSVPGTNPTLSLANYDSNLRFDNDKLKASLADGTWESEDIDNCDVTVNGFTEGGGKYDVEINSENPDGENPQVTVDGTWIAQATPQ